jgi:hypothetical protein
MRVIISARKGTGGAAPRRWRSPARALRLAAFVVVMTVGLAPTAPAAADTKSRAIDIMSQSYGDFLHTKSAGEAPFDWYSNGCNLPTPPPWSWEQDGPCQLHDFGYSNFGFGLTLERTEARRAWIDERFLQEMQRNCSEHPWYTSCGLGIYAMYTAVRNFNNWSN